MLTPHAFQKLLNHLINIEERKTEILNNFFSESSDSVSYYSSALDKYIKKLEDIITTVQVINEADSDYAKLINTLPYVIIGSSVILENITNQDTRCFKIIWPYGATYSRESLSCLSELGRVLMLKNTGDIISMNFNEDDAIYKIKLIQYD
jgi:transcription elongation GreA/GreB family factor